jgi:hypothetical protein
MKEIQIQRKEIRRALSDLLDRHAAKGRLSTPGGGLR